MALPSRAWFLLAVLLPLCPSLPGRAIDLTSESYVHRGGTTSAAGSASLTRAPAQPAGGSSLGQAEALGLSGVAANLTTSAPGFWPLVTGALPSVDLDGDGLPNSVDTDDDGDGLDDGVETDTGSFIDASDTGSDPLIVDSDGDGLADGLEVAAGSDPTDPASVPAAVPALGPGLRGLFFLLFAGAAVVVGARSERRCQ